VVSTSGKPPLAPGAGGGKNKRGRGADDDPGAPSASSVIGDDKKGDTVKSLPQKKRASRGSSAKGTPKL
jgi:hypothetical protein